MAPAQDNNQKTARSNSIPPWEEQHIARVPYVDASSAALSRAEREALPSFWATTSHNNTATASYGDANTHQGYDRTQYSDTYHTPDSPTTNTPLTAPIMDSSNRSPVYIPPGPKTTSALPSFPEDSSPSSEDSFAATRSSSVFSSQSHPSPKPLSVLPGTMSSQHSPRQPHERTPTSRSERKKKKKASLLRRWQAALKEVFTHRAVDESQLVAIEDRHWADEWD